MCLENLPQPQFNIGQRVEIQGFSDDTGEPYSESGIIYGISFFSDIHPQFGRTGWHYCVHFDSPRVFDDFAYEGHLQQSK